MTFLHIAMFVSIILTAVILIYLWYRVKSIKAKKPLSYSAFVASFLTSLTSSMLPIIAAFLVAIVPPAPYPIPPQPLSLYSMIDEIIDKSGVPFLTFGLKSDGSPIVWRVMTQSKSSIQLMSDMILLCEQFDESGSSKWSTSSLRVFLNNDFLLTYFNQFERLCLNEAHANDYVSIPTKNDLIQPLYGFANNSTNISRVAYADSGSGNEMLNVQENGTAVYFTRTVASASSVITVLYNGSFGYVDVRKCNIGVRPMITLDYNLIQSLGGIGSRDDPFRIEPFKKEI